MFKPVTACHEQRYMYSSMRWMHTISLRMGIQSQLIMSVTASFCQRPGTKETYSESQQVSYVIHIRLNWSMAS